MASGHSQVRRRPTKQRPYDAQRDSNLVRASVLETALELGLTQSSTVANWIFNNPLAEEPEDIQLDTDGADQIDSKSETMPELTEVVTPTLTSALNTISGGSSSTSSPPNSAANVPVATFQIHTHKPSVTESPHVSFGEFSSDQLQLFSPFALSPPEPYRGETDSSSLGKPSKDSDRSRSQDDSLCRDRSNGCPSPGPADIGYTSEGQYLSQGKGGKGSGKNGKSKVKKGSKPQALDLNKSGGDTDYASDGGYLSASSNKSQGKSPGKVKARAMAFFRRRPKKSAHGSDNEDEDDIPPVPAIPSFPKPSSPKPLERRAPSPPTRPGFHPLTLKLTSPSGSSPPRRRVSKSPPPRVGTPHRLGQSPGLQPPSPKVASISATVTHTPSTTAATFPLQPSAPGTPLSTASFPAPVTPSTPITVSTVAQASLSQSPRPHLGIPPPAPPPSQPLPQPPPSPSSAAPVAISSSLPLRPGTPSRARAPSRPIPVVPGHSGLQAPQSLSPRRAPSPFQALLSPKALPTTCSDQKVFQIPDVEEYAHTESDRSNGGEASAKQQSATNLLSAGFGSTPAFLQRRVQHRSPSPRPPPDMPLPPAPNPSPNARARTPIHSPSKFHEHFSSTSSVPTSLTSPTPSTATLSGSSSGPSVRSSHTSSTSDRSEVPPLQDSLTTSDNSRPTTSTSTTSEVRPLRLNKVSDNLKSRFSGRSEASSSVYPPTTHRDSGTTCDDDDVDIDDVAPKSFIDEDDDDASVYPSEEKTAGRRTMYLFEHGGLDENGDEIVMAGSHYWNKEVPPPLPTRPGFF